MKQELYYIIFIIGSIICTTLSMIGYISKILLIIYYNIIIIIMTLYILHIKEQEE